MVQPPLLFRGELLVLGRVPGQDVDMIQQFF